MNISTALTTTIRGTTTTPVAHNKANVISTSTDQDLDYEHAYMVASTAWCTGSSNLERSVWYLNTSASQHFR